LLEWFNFDTGEVLIKLEGQLAGQLAGVDTSGCGDAQRQAGDGRVVVAGAQRIAHEAGEEPVALAAGEPRATRWTGCWTRRPGYGTATPGCGGGGPAA